MTKPRHMDRSKNYPTPAEWQITRSDGTVEWRTDDRLHRVGAPAKIYPDGGEEWWVNGRLHREGGPAVKYACGYVRWHEDDRIHCLHGPAVVHRCGYWHTDGKCITSHGRNPLLADRQEWYVRGRQFTEEEFIRYVDTLTGEVFVPPGRFLLHGFTCTWP